MADRPKTFQKLVVTKLTTNFREAVTIKTIDMCHPKKGEVCIKNRYVGINATDVNITKGRYFVDGNVPFDIGFEGVGEVVAVGDGIESLKIGSSVAYLNSKKNSYAEYVCVPATDVFPIPQIKPEYIILLVSGLTSAIGLDKAGHIIEGETVLITAAAGGAGHIAVQWAKGAGCQVIGTCSTEEKENILKNLGCDRVINYKKENLAEVLAKEYPNGIDVIWETIGGKVFEDCLKNLSCKGRLLIIGGISGYKNEDSKEALPKVDFSKVPDMLLFKSATLKGFLLLHYQDCFPTYLKHLCDSYENGQLKAIIDCGQSTGTEFIGMEGIIRGVEHLHSGKSIGKVVVKLA